MAMICVAYNLRQKRKIQAMPCFRRLCGHDMGDQFGQVLLRGTKSQQGREFHLLHPPSLVSHLKQLIIPPLFYHLDAPLALSKRAAPNSRKSQSQVQSVPISYISPQKSVTIGRASRPFPRSKRSGRVSPHSAFRTRPCDPFWTLSMQGRSPVLLVDHAQVGSHRRFGIFRST
jgi:hypothetical protein